MTTKMAPKQTHYLEELDGLRELHQLLCAMQRTRAEQQQQMQALDRLLKERDLALYECYRVFRCNNGVTGDDLLAFLRDYFTGKADYLKPGRLRIIVAPSTPPTSDAA